MEPARGKVKASLVPQGFLVDLKRLSILYLVFLLLREQPEIFTD